MSLVYGRVQYPTEFGEWFEAIVNIVQSEILADVLPGLVQLEFLPNLVNGAPIYLTLFQSRSSIVSS